jgi:hypothetical protein
VVAVVVTEEGIQIAAPEAEAMIADLVAAATAVNAAAVIPIERLHANVHSKADSAAAAGIPIEHLHAIVHPKVVSAAAVVIQTERLHANVLLMADSAVITTMHLGADLLKMVLEEEWQKAIKPVNLPIERHVHLKAAREEVRKAAQERIMDQLPAKNRAAQSIGLVVNIKNSD